MAVVPHKILQDLFPHSLGEIVGVRRSLLDRVATEGTQSSAEAVNPCLDGLSGHPMELLSDPIKLGSVEPRQHL